jgi:hypothetical protein
MDSSNERRPATERAARWPGILRKLQSLVDARWPVALFRIVNVLLLVTLGVMVEHAALATVIVLFIFYGVAFGLAEYVLSETSEDIERRVSEIAKQQNLYLVTEMETYAAAEAFLTDRLRRNTGAVSVLQRGDPELIPAATQSIAKLPAINETLRDLCESLSAICSKNRLIPRPEAWFRATYMELQGPPEDQKLVYIGWHTLDGTPPRSMSLGVTFRKGEGCAGLAWERNRPVIEDDFRDRHEWKENYPKQGTNYKSMICVPVLKGHGSNMGEVIGVITVDTHIDHYFGTKDDRAQEDKISSMIRPYGTYVSFISVVDDAVRDLRTNLAISRHSQLSIAPPVPDKRPLD